MFFIAQIKAQFKLTLANYQGIEGPGTSADHEDTPLSLSKTLLDIAEDGLLNAEDNEELSLLLEAKSKITKETQEEIKNMLDAVLETGFNVVSPDDLSALNKTLKLSGFPDNILNNIPKELQESAQGYIVKIESQDADPGSTGKQLFVYEINDSHHGNDVKGFIDQTTGEWNDYTYWLSTRDDHMAGNNKFQYKELENDELITLSQSNNSDAKTTNPHPQGETMEKPNTSETSESVSDTMKLNNTIQLIDWAKPGISEKYGDVQNPTKEQIIQGLKDLQSNNFNASSQLPTSVQYVYSLQVAMSMIMKNNSLGNIDGMWGTNSSKNFTSLQNKLNSEGFNCGSADGKPGPNTIKALVSYMEK